MTENRTPTEADIKLSMEELAEHLELQKEAASQHPARKDGKRMLNWYALAPRWEPPVNEDDPVDDSVFTCRRGIVRFADGTEHKALLDFCESDSNEHYGTSILIAENPECFEDCEESFTHQEDADFLEKLGKTKDQVYPYKYKYEGPRCYDHHIGDDGWSR